MPLLDKNFFDIRYLDTLAQGDTWLHRLDPRAKLLTTLLYIITVVSFNKYTVTGLLPFVLYPVVLISVGDLPVSNLLNKLLLVAPFALLIGLFNPLIDHSVQLHAGPWKITGGWISFFSLLIRFTLTVGTVLVFISLTSFNGLCFALERFRVPSVFIMQLLFLYRYLFVLMEEALRMSRARTLRSSGSSATGMRVYGSLIGHLLLRTLNKAERIHLAMRCRGFDGHIRINRATSFGRREVAFVLSWSIFFLTMRLYDIPQIIGKSVTAVIT